MKSGKGFVVLMLLIALLIGGALALYQRVIIDSPEDIMKINPNVPLDPGKEYTITVWDYFFPGRIGEFPDYRGFLESLIDEFRKNHPNIKISYELLNIALTPDMLREAIEEGAPPDLICSPLPCILDPSENHIQVPVEIFLDEKEKNDYEAFALEAGRVDGIMWSLPRWISPSFWLGNVKHLRDAGMNIEDLLANGWTWKEFHNVLEKLEKGTFRDLNQGYGVILAEYHSWLFQDLALNNGLTAMLSRDGKFLWEEEDIVETARFLSQLQKRKAFCREPEPFYGKTIELLLRGKVAIVGGANLPLLKRLMERSQEIRKGSLRTDYPQPPPEIIPIPLPHNSIKEWRIRAEVFYISILKREKGVGDDHIKAAVEFAKFLTRDKAAVSGAYLGFLPAFRPAQGSALTSMSLPPMVEGFLLNSFSHGIASANYHPALRAKEEEFIEEVLLPAVRELLEGRITPEGFGERITSAGTKEFPPKKGANDILPRLKPWASPRGVL